MRLSNGSILNDTRNMRLSVLTRGALLHTLLHEGAYYIEAPQDATYSIRLKNEGTKPLWVVVSVDGCDIRTIKPASICSERTCIDASSSLEFNAWNGGEELLKFSDPRDRDKVNRLPMSRRPHVGVIGVAVCFDKESRPDEILTVYYRTREWLVDHLIIKDMAIPFPV